MNYKWDKTINYLRIREQESAHNNSVKYLGVILDNKLSCKGHLD